MEAAIISAAVSILLFVGTQWMLAIRQRTEFLTAKVEELWQAIEDIAARQALPDFTTESFGEVRRVMLQTSTAICVSLSKPRMLCSLYFPSAMDHFSEFSTACGKLAEEFIKLGSSDSPPSASDLARLFQELSVRAERLKGQILEDYDAMTGEPWAVLKRWWCWLTN